MRSMRKLVNVLIVTMVAGSALALAQAPDATKVLANMRAALGGADKVAAVKTLTAAGTIQRVTPQGTTESETELTLELPDKYVAHTVLVNRGNLSTYRNVGFNGSGLINETDAPPNLLQVARDRPVAVGASDARTPDGGAPAPPTPEQRAEAAQRMVLAAKKDFARMMLGMLGSSYEAFPLQFSYAGEAEAPDGKAHVIEAHGADRFEARLFVNVKTSLPLMQTWTMGNAARTVEHRTFYSNFKKVGGLNLPHTLQHSVDGTLSDETTFAEIKINPKIDSKKFTISK